MLTARFALRLDNSYDLHGTYRQRARRAERGPRLPDGTPVVVAVVQTPEVKENRQIPTLYERLKPVIGIAEGLPPDASQNIDHYLYGHPKK